MDIGINADVLCHDELVGHVSCVIIDVVVQDELQRHKMNRAQINADFQD